MIERTDPVNWSTLKHILTSPKHYRHILSTPREDTEALQLGRITHCAVYEPDELDSRYLIAPRFHRGMKDATARAKGYEGGKESAAAWDAEVAEVGAEVVDGGLYQRAIGMRDAVLADPVAGPMVTGGYSEQALTWTVDGIECRGRLDHINGRLSDLKTTRNIRPRRFMADVARYQYHAQTAWYDAGLEANGVVTEGQPAIIAVESSAPYDVLVVFMGDAVLRAGWELCRNALDRLAGCRHLDSWPGVSGGDAVPLELPAWAMPEDDPITLGGESVF